ncbi:hypothetical protein [Duganella levis]|uniref:hypothetical protein n=1 Tax=Duganella levis TaxID=2692169 RepID=UPI0019280379|nr:hypothetical protein [Duganella levis]
MANASLSWMLEIVRFLTPVMLHIFNRCILLKIGVLLTTRPMGGYLLGELMLVYTLLEKENTEELHLFEGEMLNTNPETCNVPAKSICRKMNKSESSDTKFACQDEVAARKACASRGRIVCGTCVSHLYTDY